MTKTILIGILINISFLFSQDLQKYKNYNFVPGNRIVFDDNLLADKNGANPVSWNIEGGKVAIVSNGNDKFISIKEYYTILSPKIKNNSYLSDTFTIEYDSWLDAGYDGNPGVELHFRTGSEEVAVVTPNKLNSGIKYPSGEKYEPNPSDISSENYYNKWIHVAIVYVNKKIKLYLNQHEIVSVENCNFKPNSIYITGNTSNDLPIYFKNLVISNGAVQIEKDLNIGKFVTQNIRFDFNKSTLKPESMGTLNQIVAALTKNTLKYEISGHTDSDGDEAINLKLSQERAEVVKNFLISSGINANRLISKGYGETKPLASNDDEEDGRELNRRTEFKVIQK